MVLMKIFNTISSLSELLRHKGIFKKIHENNINNSTHFLWSFLEWIICHASKKKF